MPHDIRQCGDMICCLKCGAYATKRTHGLAKLNCLEGQVFRDASRATLESRLARLRQGRHALTNVLMGRPQRYSGIGEWALLEKCLSSAELDAELTRMHDETEGGTEEE